MKRNFVFHKKKVLVVFCGCMGMLLGLVGRLAYLMVFRSDYYYEKSEELHQRERPIKAARGEILDCNGVVLAANKTVCTVSVIHSQIEDADAVVELLGHQLQMDEETVRKKVEKVSSMERIRTNVEKEIGDKIRNAGLAGVKVDEDYRRFYPYGELASKVLGFTGSDNQGIVGLEVEYEKYLQGEPGQILTLTDARGVELETKGENRREPVAGYNLRTSLDYNIQCYAQQAARKVMEEKQADYVSILIMNPQTGEIMAMVNVPEYNLNDPFTLLEEPAQEVSQDKKQDLLNQMWRNPCINDTYEPGSTFKIITASAGLEEGVVKLEDTFQCGGYRVVEDRRIHCHKRTGHGAETFLEGAQNSCNPVFIDVGMRLGVDNYYKYFKQFGLLDPTGIDLPGEASTIMHKKSNIGLVELATISFGQSFQITPLQLASTVSSLINGGTRITPHLGVSVESQDGTYMKKLNYQKGKRILSEETSETLRYILGKVVSDGSGARGAVEGYTVGGKTATSQTLPRSANRYISSFIGFSPVENPEVLGLCIISNPQGIYYGGTIAAPVISSIFQNILPYLENEKAHEVEKE